MTIDLAVLVLLALFGLLGLASGAAKQLSHWAGLVLGLAAARPLAAAAAPAVADKLGWPPLLAGVALSCLLFVVLAAVGAAAAHFIFVKALPGRELGPFDRGLGFVLGAGKAAAVLFVALSALVFFEKPLAKAGGGVATQLKDSRAAGLARSHDLFARLRLPALDGVRRMLEAQKDPAALRKLLDDPQLKAALDDPRLKAALADPALRRALVTGDTSALLASPALKELLSDPALSGQLSRLKAR